MNELLTKLINKINFDYAKKFDLRKEQELSFVPVNMQDGALFAVICLISDKELVLKHVESVLECKVKFIHLSEPNFEEFFAEYTKLVTASHPDKPGVSVLAGGGDKSSSNTLDSDVQELLNKPIDIKLESIDVKLDIPDTQIQKTPAAVASILSTESAPQANSTLIHNIHKTALTTPRATMPPELPSAPAAPVAPIAPDVTAISKVESPKTKKIGEILLEAGLINDKQLTIALAEAKVLKIPLGSVLVKLGFISIKDLKSALSAQKGSDLATAEQLKALPEAISTFPEDFVKANKVIPLSAAGKTLTVGMVNPGDTRTINEVIMQTGLKPIVIMITHYEFEKFVQTYYQAEKKQTDAILRQLEKDSENIEQGDTLWEQVEREIQDTSGSVSKFANQIITYAIDLKASDVHIEPRLSGFVVRYRINGMLKEVFKIPPKVESAIIARFKVLARMNIAEHRRSQDGNFTIKYKDSSYDFRINTLPVLNKEKMVIRVLASASSIQSATREELRINGMSQEDLDKVKRLVSAPNGIILTSGPTGSGKTTTLYSVINTLNSEDVNITTIEDPVEIKLDGVNQSAVNAKAGITFATSMRAMLRQDPDIILVGEIRDYETLEVAISASLTGHLVLSTIHTNSCAATVTRLIEMGAKDYLIASTLAGVLAQRLARKLCPDCKVAYQPNAEEARQASLDPGEIQKLMSTNIYKMGPGCHSCSDSGYAGRLGIYEVLVINKEIRKLIAQRTHDVEIEEYAMANGMKTLRQACIDHILDGNTSIDECVRILGLASD
ncbi:type IV pilus assembly protein PilB [Candidatus Gastranaerophilus sp. (ex Termes propinquus)]|nr:type IV pilus assembly protein PilB [Candidatus Gastranaerophilus sp. (ex Termes propinquus)]